MKVDSLIERFRSVARDSASNQITPKQNDEASAQAAQVSADAVTVSPELKVQEGGASARAARVADLAARVNDGSYQKNLDVTEVAKAVVRDLF